MSFQRHPWMDYPGTDTPEEDWPEWCATCERYTDEACPACGDEGSCQPGEKAVDSAQALPDRQCGGFH